MILKFATNQDPWPWVWVLFRVFPSLISVASSCPIAAQELPRWRPVHHPSIVWFTILKPEPPTRALGSQEEKEKEEEKEKAQSSFQSDDFSLRDGDGAPEAGAGRPAARATRVRLCSSGVLLLALRFSFKKNLLFLLQGKNA